MSCAQQLQRVAEIPFRRDDPAFLPIPAAKLIRDDGHHEVQIGEDLVRRIRSLGCVLG
jgi:hypothetical protein